MHTETAPINSIMRALADPTRRAVFERIAGSDEMTVVELTRGSGVTQGAISQHLKSLKQAGLVAERPEGRNVFYRANPGGLAPLADWMNHYSIFWRDSFDRLRDLLAEIDPPAAPAKPALSASAGSKAPHASARKKTRDIQND